MLEISSEGQWPFSRDLMQSNCFFSTVAADDGTPLYTVDGGTTLYTVDGGTPLYTVDGGTVTPLYTGLHIAPTFDQSTLCKTSLHF